MSDDLFSAIADNRRASHAPLAERMRPTTIDEVVGQDHLLARCKPLRSLIDSDRLGSIVLWGPPGTGKTTIARLVAKATKRYFVPLSAVSAGVKDVREVLAGARMRLGEHNMRTILFLDEVHRFSKSQQDALLPGVEDGTVSLIGATTENPYFEVNAPLLSRSTLFRLEPLTKDALAMLTKRALEHESVTASDDAIVHLCDSASGDARGLLTALDVAIALATTRKPDAVNITLEDVEAAMSHRMMRYGEDEHYDIISAFIKSIRGSDVDAGLYWLARMITAGEDVKFIARRLVILASEDIGEADPQSLLVATAAAQAVQFVGLPEAGLNLAHAVVHLARAPKSNSSYVAWSRAMQDVQAGGMQAVPPHLRDAHYPGARSLQHGKGYLYPHDFQGGRVEQQYRPDALQDHQYFEATPNDMRIRE